jgi:[protein-PII] uridylyltransferase
MQINRESIQVHARERLDAPGLAENREGQIEAFKRFLKLETERLRMRHRFGLGGSEIATGRSYQIDMVVTRACQVAAGGADRVVQRELQQCAVVALGGYGRGELAPFSDVDLLFLHPGRPSDAVARFVEQVLQILWDVGLTVGHSYRSPRECVAEAKDDLHSRTALTEARLVAGSSTLYQALLRQLETDLRNRRSTEAFLESMRTELAERGAKVGGAVCVLEPNVKEGLGGLRDLHAILWVGHARYGSRGLSGLHAEGWISEREYVAARRAYDFLSRVRNEAHFATGRKTDLLTLDLQPELARSLGYKAKGGLLPSELFMRDYFRRASELHEVRRGFMLIHLAPEPRRSLFGFRRPRSHKGFTVKDGKLHVRGEELKGGPMRILEAFAHAQGEGLDLSEELKRAIRERTEAIDRAFRSSRDATRAFLRLLERRGRVGPTLRAMHETGVLGRLLPEWARITFLVQHDFFHKYTVDEHTLKAVEALDEVATGTDHGLARLGKVFDEVGDAMPLYLGMLLHDIGKGRGAGHVVRGVKIAGGIFERLRLEAGAAENVRFLIDAHLEMSQLSQQRDLSEPGLAPAFAARVGSLERLNLLFLLTYADHRAVGPGIWNEWKASLLWELYDRARPHLAGGERRREDADRGERTRETAVAELLDEVPGDDVQRHFAMLPERYLRTTSADRMVRHFRLLRSLGERPAAVEWEELPERLCSELTVTAHDRPGLLASLTGTLTANGIDILSVDLFNRDDGLVIDTFIVSEVATHRPVAPERCARIARDLGEAAAGRLDVGRAVEKWRASSARRPRRQWARGHREPAVRFDGEGSATATIVEVRAPDQPGLAYTIADTLAHLGLDITFAKIATAKALALDVFYVTDAAGRKLAPEILGEVEDALLTALGARSRTRD